MNVLLTNFSPVTCGTFQEIGDSVENKHHVKKLDWQEYIIL